MQGDIYKVLAEMETLENIWESVQHQIPKTILALKKRNLPLDHDLIEIYEDRIRLVRSIKRHVEQFKSELGEHLSYSERAPEDESQDYMQENSEQQLRTARYKKAEFPFDLDGLGLTGELGLEVAGDALNILFAYQKLAWTTAVLVGGAYFLIRGGTKAKSMSRVTKARQDIDNHKISMREIAKLNPSLFYIKLYIEDLTAIVWNLKEELVILDKTSALNFK